MDFGDLKDDKAIQDKLQNFHNSVEKIKTMLELTQSSDLYEKLSTKEKIDYDLFLAFALNSLFWLYLRTKGEDPNKHEIKQQLTRIKEHMMKAKQQTSGILVRPKIDQAASARVIKHGINYKTDKPPNKKMKFDD